MHETHRNAGFGAEVITLIQEKAIFSLEIPFETVTGWDIVVPLTRTENHYLPKAGRIVRAGIKTMEA